MRVPAGLLPVVLLSGLVAACGPNQGGGTPDGGTGGKTQPKVRHYTFRALAGVSMGAIGTSAVGPEHADRFDAFGALGGPFDAAYMLHFLQTQELGGFCTYQDYLKLLKDHPGDTSILDDKATIEACAIHPATTQPFEHPSSFNDWWFDDNGGTFDRSAYIDLFEDLSLALGNPAYENAASPFFPPGVDDSWTCANPVVIKGTDHGGTHPVYNAEYNPDGRFDAVTFCDGEEPITVCQKTGQPVDFCSGQTPDAFCGADGPAITPSKSTLKAKWPDVYYSEKGAYDPCQPHHQRIRIALAVDYDGDGKRDYGEPLIVNAAERFEDTGVDGCADPQEDGKGGCVAAGATGPYDPSTDPDPNGDDYSWQTNPTGTEHDFKWEQGETYADDGLDGVPNTGDFGEGNGKYDMSANEKNFFAHDARTAIENWSDATVHRVGYYLDGGIRDIFNFGVNASQVFGAPRRGGRRPRAGTRTSPRSPASPATGTAPTPGRTSISPRSRGGPCSSTAPSAPPTSSGAAGTAPTWAPAPRSSTGSTPSSTGERPVARQRLRPGHPVELRHPQQDALLRQRVPGLEARLLHRPAAGLRRPGQRRPHLPGALLPPRLRPGPPGDGRPEPGHRRLRGRRSPPEDDRRLRRRAVLHGRRPGEPRLRRDSGEDLGSKWHRECHAGSFYVNRTGMGSADQTPYADSLFELMDYVDANYRTKPRRMSPSSRSPRE